MLKLFRKNAHVGKAVLRTVQNGADPAKVFEKLHKPLTILTRQFIRIPIGSDIPLLQSGKMPVQRRIIVFPVTFPKG